MRRLAAALLLCAACGTHDCPPENRTYNLHASTAFVTPGCEALSAAFDVTATMAVGDNESLTLTGTENGVSFTAKGQGESSDCYASPYWTDSTGATHLYFLAFGDGQSRLDVVRTGTCMVSYSLR